LPAGGAARGVGAVVVGVGGAAAPALGGGARGGHAQAVAALVLPLHLRAQNEKREGSELPSVKSAKQGRGRGLLRREDVYPARVGVGAGDCELGFAQLDAILCDTAREQGVAYGKRPVLSQFQVLFRVAAAIGEAR
jgi:hypothetical protein